MFTHRSIDSEIATQSWNQLKSTISREKAFQAAEIIGEVAAQDMLDFSGKSAEEIDRIYVKFRDGIPMAAGIRKIIPHVDIRYIVSKEKQSTDLPHEPISFYDGYDGYSSDTIWLADLINATGLTDVKSLKFVRAYFPFSTALISHAAANIVGIGEVQTMIDNFSIMGFMNYVYLSKKLNGKGYLEDGLELIKDIGDKLFGTLGSDYSIFDIQKEIRKLIGTGIGDVEILKGIVLYLIQMAGKEEYAVDRNASWMTRKWISAAMQWYRAVQEVPFKKVDENQVYTLIDDLYFRGFLKAEKRPWKNTFDYVYSLTEEGLSYVSRVYIPILAELSIPSKIQKHFDFLVHLKPEAVFQNINDKTWR